MGVLGCRSARNQLAFSSDNLAMTDLKSPPGTTAAAKTAGRGIRSTLHRFHTIAGIIIAPLIFVAAFSGFFYALSPTAESIYYRDALTATSGLEAQPASAQITAAQAAHPELTFNAVQLFDDPSRTTRVLFTDPELPDGVRRAIFVDPGDLHITGDEPMYGSNHSLPLRAFISHGHKDLWLGEPGRIYSELAASWMGALAISGTWLWWVRRQKIARGAKSSKRNGSVKMHSTLGLVVLPGMLALTITGLTWSLVAGENISELRTALNWKAPKPALTAEAVAGGAPAAASSAGGAHAEHQGHGSAMPATDAGTLAMQADTVYAAARGAGLTDLVELQVPKEPGQAWTAQESRLPMKYSNDKMTIDGQTGQQVDYVKFADWPFPAKLTEWLIQGHMGILFGLTSQLALALLAVGIMASVGYGYLMWFRRGKGSKFGRLPSASNWGAVDKKSVAVLLVCMAVYAAIAPLFGISLVAFAVVDLVWRKVRGRGPTQKVAPPSAELSGQPSA